MPDGAKNFTYDGTNGPISTTITTRSDLITAMEHLNYASGYNIRAIDELSGTGILVADGLGTAYQRSIAASSGLTVANANGAGGNPTISLGTPSTFRKALADTESNTVTNNKMVSILSTGTSYAVPAADSGFISHKTIINNTSEMITLTGSVWADTSITTVRIPPESKVDLISDTVGKWYAYHTSVKNPMGAIYITSASATTISDTTNYFAAAGTTSLNTSESVVHLFDQPSNGQLRYTGKVPIHAHIAVTASVTTASNSQVIHTRISHYDNSAASATDLVHSEVQQKSQATGGDVLSTALHADVVMEENDYLYVSMRNETTASNATLTHCYMFALGVPILTT